jgi:hypothetical protein
MGRRKNHCIKHQSGGAKSVGAKGTDAFGFMMQKGMALEGKVVLG